MAKQQAQRWKVRDNRIASLLTKQINRNKGQAAATDPHFADVSLLLHFDGTNGGTSFVDSSVNQIAVAGYGDASTSTGQSKFGGSSGDFTSGTGYLETAADSSAILGNSDFTVEFWTWCQTVTGLGGFWLRADTGQASEGLVIGIDETNGDGILISDGQGWAIASGNVFGPSMQDETWHHIVLAREADSWRAFCDGQLVWSDTSSISVSQPASGAWRIGAANQGNAGIPCYIDDFRLTVGHARYAAAFTPSESPFPNA